MQRLNLKIDNLRIEGNSRDGIAVGVGDIKSTIESIDPNGPHRSVDGVSMSVEDVPANAPDPNGTTTTLLTDAAQHERSYDEICEDSRTYVDVGDVAAWRIGDNALELLRLYPEKTLDDYAKDIRKPKGTISEYTRMADYFPPDVRDTLYRTCPGISRSHMRKVLSIKDKDKGRELVELAAAHGLTVDHFGRIMKRYKRLKGIGRKPQPRVVRETFEATVSDGLGSLVRFNVTDVDKFWDVVTTNKAARVSVLVEYTEAGKT